MVVQHSSDQPRTIPTRVGRTIGRVAKYLVSSDHPHAGGENHRAHTKFPAVRGPSPRGWGEPKGDVEREQHRRTIPTRVGRTRRQSRRSE